jgi:L-ribulokinase
MRPAKKSGRFPKSFKENGALESVLQSVQVSSTLLPTERGITAIPGISGVVKDGIVPGYYGVEAGQAAVGDIVNWYVKNQQFGSEYSEERLHEELTDRARQLQAGESGLLALDWHNGNRNVLMDPQLSGLIIGYTLQTAPQEIYRTLIESTGFGARAIIDRLKEYGVPVDEIICCGGIAEKNDLFMKIYANIMNQPIKIARSLQAPAFGAAICAAVAAGKTAGGYDTLTDAIERMTGVRSTVFTPNPEAVKIYDKLYELYMKLHNIYGTKDERDNLFSVMKKLIEIRESVVKE